MRIHRAKNNLCMTKRKLPQEGYLRYDKFGITQKIQERGQN